MNRFELCEALAGAIERSADEMHRSAIEALQTARSAGIKMYSSTGLVMAELALKEAAIKRLAMLEVAVSIRDPDRFLSCNYTHSSEPEPFS